jgi:hypothetical protein
MDLGYKVGNLAKRYAPAVTVSTLLAPLHEGLHALTATVLLNVGCKGITLNEDYISSHVLELLTVGYCKAESMDSTTGGYANIFYEDNFLGHIGAAMTSAIPEVATMGLGFYWIHKGMKGINESGERVRSLFYGVIGMELVAHTYSYATNSISNHEGSSDYVNFTKHLLDAVSLSGDLAPALTVFGTGAMAGTAMYLAGKVDPEFKKKDKPKSKRTWYGKKKKAPEKFSFNT